MSITKIGSVIALVIAGLVVIAGFSMLGAFRDAITLTYWVHTKHAAAYWLAAAINAGVLVFVALPVAWLKSRSN